MSVDRASAAGHQVRVPHTDPLGGPALVRTALALGAALASVPSARAADDPFAPLDPLLPTPSDSRLGSGYPGPGYWQQRADYEIDVELHEAERLIEGSARITYTNRSPHHLPYLWLQIDNNIFARDSDAALSAVAPDLSDFSYRDLARVLMMESFDGSIQLTEVTNDEGVALRHRVEGTLLRVDPLEAIAPGTSFVVRVGWRYRINDATVIRARTGYERFDDGNAIFEIAHWYPRVAAYSLLRGWHNDQFLGRGEFTLEFGDFLMRLEVPEDHVVAATGVLQNPVEVLSPTERSRLEAARSRYDRPTFVVTPEEAAKKEETRTQGKKTWIFAAENVRDVAWASSRKFIWDAMGVKVEDDRRTVLAMSYYPNEAEPLWSRYSTRAVAHTLDVYGKYTFPYPYPVAISVNGPVGGMEYPMICFNGPRPREDGTYYGRVEKGSPWKHSKYGLISVIIHEVGHNWFPMIVNQDERRWTWMDEGLNTFLQFLAEQEWSEGYPSRRGFAEDITAYMTSPRQVPIMTESQSILQFGNNAYAKPATALNILRETVLGRETFDDAFRRYARAWRFRRPTPADFFRILEDASGRDLDWFFRGWFYTTDHVDIALSDVRVYALDTKDPRIDKAARRADREAEPESITEIRDEGMDRLVERVEGLKDFYDDYDPLDVTKSDIQSYEELLESLDEDQKALLQTKKVFTVLDFENRGGLVMPIILRLSYEGGEQEVVRIPAHIWRRNPKRVSKLFLSETPMVKVEIDPFVETADADRTNNQWPKVPVRSRFELFEDDRDVKDPPMLKAREDETGDDPEPSGSDSPSADPRENGGGPHAKGTAQETQSPEGSDPAIPKSGSPHGKGAKEK